MGIIKDIADIEYTTDAEVTEFIDDLFKGNLKDTEVHIPTKSEKSAIEKELGSPVEFIDETSVKEFIDRLFTKFVE